jgi:hypothetical protein
MATGEIIQKEEILVEPETGEKPVIKVEPPQHVYETNKTIVWNKRILWYIWFVIELLLLLRFIIKLFGANTWSAFHILITILTFPFVILFTGLFTSTFWGKTNEIEWSTLFAMLVYILLALAASRFFKIKKPIDPTEAQAKS